jgi:hypothetical protein
MKKYYILLLLVFIPMFGFAQSNIVAEVAGEPLTWLELQNRYEKVWQEYLRDPSSYQEVSQKAIHEDLKKIALDQIIIERLFEIYADENNIFINDEELETIFKQIYSDNALFLTDGYFDETKFQRFKMQYPKRYHEIINRIRDDVLDDKIKEIIKEQFYLNDRELYEAYIRDNSRIQLKYLIVPDSLMPTNFPSSPAFVKEFHKAHKYSYQSPDMVRLGIIYIQDDEFYPSSKPYYKHVPAYRKNAHAQSRIYAEQLADLLNSGYDENSPIFRAHYMFETGYLQKSDHIGKMEHSDEIIKKALRLSPGRYYSSPIEQENGWIIFKSLGKKGGGIADFEDAALPIWKDYISVGRDYYFDSETESFFNNNIEHELLFEVDVSYISFDAEDLEIDMQFSEDSLWNYYEYNLEEFVTVRDTMPFEKVREDMVEELTKKAKRKLADSTITCIKQRVCEHDFLMSYPGAEIKLFQKYIENMPYFREPYPLIQDTIFQTPVDSMFFTKKGTRYVIGLVNDRRLVLSREKKSLKEDVQNLLENKWDTDWQNGFQEFYSQNKNSYFEPNLFRFSYIFIPIDTSQVIIDSSDAEAYFSENMDKFIQSNRVKLQTVFIPENPLMYQKIQDILDAMHAGVDFDVISDMYYQPHSLIEKDNTFISANDLNELIYSCVDTLGMNEISSPIYTDEGCFFIKLIDKERNDENIFELKKPQVFYEMKLPLADSIAYRTIKTIYDNISSNREMLFDTHHEDTYYTDYMGLDDEYTVIDSLITLPKREYDELNSIRIGNKFPKIFTVKGGYAILFLEDKVTGKKIAGYDAYTKARDEFLSKLQFDEGKIFTEYLTIELMNRQKGYLTYIFGGLRETPLISYDDMINNLPGSNVIVRSAFSKEPYTYSHPIRFTDYGWGFYYVAKKEVETPQDFESIKHVYRQEYVEKKFRSWIDNYMIQKQVRIFVQ